MKFVVARFKRAAAIRGAVRDYSSSTCRFSRLALSLFFLNPQLGIIQALHQDAFIFMMKPLPEI